MEKEKLSTKQTRKMNWKMRITYSEDIAIKVENLSVVLLVDRMVDMLHVCIALLSFLFISVDRLKSILFVIFSSRFVFAVSCLFTYIYIYVWFGWQFMRWIRWSSQQFMFLFDCCIICDYHFDLWLRDNGALTFHFIVFHSMYDCWHFGWY